MRTISIRVLPFALAASIVSLPMPSHAEFSEDFSIFSPAGFAGMVARSAVSYGRLIADIRYDSLEVDAERGALLLRGLAIEGLGSYSECRIDLGSLKFDGLSLWSYETTRGRITVRDLSIANNCFGANAGMIGIATGGPTIRISDLDVSGVQTIGSGRTDIEFALESPDIARISAVASFDYFSLSSPDLLHHLLDSPAHDRSASPAAPDGYGMPDTHADPTPPPVPRGTLRNAHVTIEDRGGLERLQALLPPDAVGVAIDEIVTAPAGSPMGDFQRDLADAARTFLANGGQMTAQVRPLEPVDFDFAQIDTPDQAIELFAPQIVEGRGSPAVALVADPSDISDPRALGLALASGQGVPRDRARAVEMLMPFAGDADVDLELARQLTAMRTPSDAYPRALSAAAGSMPDAVSLLDQIETTLPLSDILSAQQPATTELPAEVFATTDQTAELALRYARGEGIARSYGLAYRLGLIAAARGHGGAQALIDQLDRDFGEDEAWHPLTRTAIDAANDDWMRLGLGK
ncbi:MAG: hypothetical protein ACK4GC_03455 [Paracoccaceae bacterium]